jgi:hypothetical protein
MISQREKKPEGELIVTVSCRQSSRMYVRSSKQNLVVMCCCVILCERVNLSRYRYRIETEP